MHIFVSYSSIYCNSSSSSSIFVVVEVKKRALFSINIDVNLIIMMMRPDIMEVRYPDPDMHLCIDNDLIGIQSNIYHVVDFLYLKVYS
mmetsp:Transcript_2622/g.5316  ORF Transcript_2622/g.5316 Transcript_2622/m.5316 type:complete len:88 (-) Transcript_2622:287-550(-)